jgi:molecular chaperone DnaJ
LNPAEAALGIETDVPTLDGPTKVAVPPGAQSGDAVRLEGKGVPYLRRSGRGDQLITLVVETPQRLSSDQKRLFEELRATLPAAGVVERQKGFWGKVKERFV